MLLAARRSAAAQAGTGAAIAYTGAVAVPLLLVAGVLTGGGVLRMPSTAEAIGLVYLGTVVSAGAFVLWYDALPQFGTDRAGLFAGVLPVGAIVTTVLLELGALGGSLREHQHAQAGTRLCS